MILLLCLWYLICSTFGSNEIHNNNYQESDTLIQLHVLFRHGNRTPNGPEELYPRDPYLRETYYPFGLGELTNAGKDREYGIGKALRTHYDKFLGELYYPPFLDARSTDFNRTKMSLLLTLASLYPPKDEEIWNRQLNWQPIPYKYQSPREDKLLQGTACPNYVRLYNEHIRSEKSQNELLKYKNIFTYISRNSGRNITTFQDVYNLNFGLSTESEWGFQLPKWTQQVFPKPMDEIAAKEYAVATATTPLSQMAIGYLLQKITGDILQKIDSRKNDTKRIYLYSAHESNLGYFLSTLRLFGNKPHVPNYGAYITIEVHNIDHIIGVKIIYENYTAPKPRLLKLPACDYFCPLDKFIGLIKEYFPPEDICGDFYWDDEEQRS